MKIEIKLPDNSTSLGLRIYNIEGVIPMLLSGAEWLYQSIYTHGTFEIRVEVSSSNTNETINVHVVVDEELTVVAVPIDIGYTGEVSIATLSLNIDNVTIIPMTNV